MSIVRPLLLQECDWPAAGPAIWGQDVQNKTALPSRDKMGAEGKGRDEPRGDGWSGDDNEVNSTAAA